MWTILYGTVTALPSECFQLRDAFQWNHSIQSVNFKRTGCIQPTRLVNTRLDSNRMVIGVEMIIFYFSAVSNSSLLINKTSFFKIANPRTLWPPKFLVRTAHWEVWPTSEMRWHSIIVDWTYQRETIILPQYPTVCTTDSVAYRSSSGDEELINSRVFSAGKRSIGSSDSEPGVRIFCKESPLETMQNVLVWHWQCKTWTVSLIYQVRFFVGSWK